MQCKHMNLNSRNVTSNYCTYSGFEYILAIMAMYIIWLFTLCTSSNLCFSVHLGTFSIVSKVQVFQFTRLVPV